MTIRNFVVVVDGDDVAQVHGMRRAVEEFDDAVRIVQDSAKYAPGTSVELWTVDDWDEDVGLPLETWEKR